MEREFSMSDGTSVTVKVTLTGEHKVVFDPSGGDHKPEDQLVTGEKRLRDRQIRKETDTRLKDGITLMRMERNRNGILMIH